MKGVILAAGYATRFLPASKTLPKEMFPLIDTPAIDLIVQEMIDSGIRDILLITSRRKKTLEDYFDREVELTEVFTKENALAKLDKIQPPEANIFTVRQQSMQGTANALMLCEPFVQNDPFVVAYPDDIVVGDPPLTQQMIQAYEHTQKTVLAVKALPQDEDISRYGVVDSVGQGALTEVRAMVEKPVKGSEPSRLVSYGRYLYTPDLFEALRKSANQHRQGEFTQTDAINQLCAQGRVCALEFEGVRYDVGEPLGYVKTTLEMAMQREEMKEPLLDLMKKLVNKYS